MREIKLHFFIQKNTIKVKGTKRENKKLKKKLDFAFRNKGRERKVI